MRSGLLAVGCDTGPERRDWPWRGKRVGEKGGVASVLKCTDKHNANSDIYTHYLLADFKVRQWILSHTTHEHHENCTLNSFHLQSCLREGVIERERVNREKKEVRECA